jgi:hypothetical protein
MKTATTRPDPRRARPLKVHTDGDATTGDDHGEPEDATDQDGADDAQRPGDEERGQKERPRTLRSARNRTPRNSRSARLRSGTFGALHEWVEARPRELRIGRVRGQAVVRAPARTGNEITS